MIMDKIAHHAYTLALTIGLVVLLLTPLNQFGLSTYNVHHSLTGNRIAVSADRKSFTIGEKIDYYRFNPSWQKPIGFVTIRSYDKGIWLADYNPEKFSWPAGIQATIVSVTGDKVELNIGSEQGVTVGDHWNIFSAHQTVGSLRITEISQQTANGEILNNKLSHTDLLELQVSPYTIANQLIVFRASGVRLFQYWVLASTFAFWLWSLFSPLPGKLVSKPGKYIVITINTISTPRRQLFWALLGIPLCYALGGFIWNLLCHLHWMVNTGLFNQQVEHFQEWGLWPVRLILVAFWYYWLRQSETSPLLSYWQKLYFKPNNSNWIPKQLKPWALWSLHLVVFYFFASTLLGFLTANINEMVKIGWSHSAISTSNNSHTLLSWTSFLPTKISGDIQALFKNLTHLLQNTPKTMNTDEWFTVVRLSLWSMTITICLIGYSYTVVSIIWSRSILRNVDFTLAGWITTGICYGAVFGPALSASTPSSSGLMPTFTQDIWWQITRISEFYLNLLYTLSILNLGLLFGVMVDKGVRSSGFYSSVRHPSYMLESLMFVTMALVALSGPLQWFAIALIFVKYWIRSEREDQFMQASNPDYRKYQKTTKWKFIPGVY